MFEFSKETKQLLKEKTGYRNSSCYNSGVTNVYDIIEFEVVELENEDIPDTLLNSQPKFKKYFNNTSPETLAKSCCDFLKECYPEYVFGLWLATKEAILNLYEGTENIEEYQLPKDYVIISDLGYDGTLFVFKNLI